MYLFNGLVMCVSVCIFVCMCIYLFIDVSDIFFSFFLVLLMVINVSLNVYLITCLMFVLIYENDDKEDAIIFYVIVYQLSISRSIYGRIIFYDGSLNHSRFIISTINIHSLYLITVIISYPSMTYINNGTCHSGA